MTHTIDHLETDKLIDSIAGLQRSMGIESKLGPPMAYFEVFPDWPGTNDSNVIRTAERYTYVAYRFGRPSEGPDCTVISAPTKSAEAVREFVIEWLRANLIRDMPLVWRMLPELYSSKSVYLRFVQVPQRVYDLVSDKVQSPKPGEFVEVHTIPPPPVPSFPLDRFTKAQWARIAAFAERSPIPVTLTQVGDMAVRCCFSETALWTCLVRLKVLPPNVYVVVGDHRLTYFAEDVIRKQFLEHGVAGCFIPAEPCPDHSGIGQDFLVVGPNGDAMYEASF